MTKFTMEWEAASSAINNDPFITARRARAKSEISDNPLALDDASAARGDVGEIVDIDGDLVMVDFGAGAIACTRDELIPMF